MIASVRAVWPGLKRTTIIVRERDTSIDTMCYVFMPEGEGIAALCDRAWKQMDAAHGDRLVLTLDPPTRWGSKIVDAEQMPANPLGPAPQVVQDYETAMDRLEWSQGRRDARDDDATPYPNGGELEYRGRTKDHWDI